ncbi:MAG TPA: hypothetical protein VN915_01950 [Elusimicrobiota bacterium]|nr:hypothetical protein [Elusimicrobiota bacterium]
MIVILALLLAGNGAAANAAAPAAAANVSWSVSADTSALTGSETRIVYRPSVEPIGARLEPDVLASGTTSFAVVKAEAQKDGSWAWTVLPLDEGKLSFVSRWKLDGQAAAAPPVELAARAPAVPKDADIDDIKGPLAASRAWWPWLLAAALGALAWEAWRRWRARPAPEGPAAPTEPPLPPEQAAQRALEALAAEGLWERGEHAAYYLRLTEILRIYLEARFGAPATAMTSVEVARLVKSRLPDLKASAVVRELLNRADLVKFARIKPDAEDGPRDAASVLDLVRATAPRAPAPAKEAVS